MIKILDASLTQQEPKRNKQILPMPTTQRIIIGDPRIHLNNGNILPLGSPYEYKIPNAATLNELGKQLLLAAQNGNLDEIKALVSKGAPFTADWLGTSPLHLAAQGNHLEICVILLRAGISRDARTKVDRTPLHMAAYEGHIEVVELLLKYEAEIDCIDLLGMTPLHWATQNENIAVVATLLRHGASTAFANKFGLTALDIANQVGRPELVEFISLGVHDPTVATENLAIELANDDNQSFQNATMMFDVDTNDAEDSQPSAENNIEDSHEDDIEEIEPEVQIDCHESEDESQISTDPIIINEDASHSFSESFKILQQHGITMLPNDDNNILTSVMESGHSVVLTDIGKDVLNAVKQSEVTNKTRYVGGKKFITVTPEEFLTLTNSNSVGKQQILRQVNGKLVPKTIKRIVMKKNKIIPISQAANAAKTKVTKVDMSTDMETVMQQLIEARKTIEEYKIKLRKKEAEAERYKQQLLLFMKNST